MTRRLRLDRLPDHGERTSVPRECQPIAQERRHPRERRLRPLRVEQRFGRGHPQFVGDVDDVEHERAGGDAVTLETDVEIAERRRMRIRPAGSGQADGDQREDEAAHGLGLYQRAPHTAKGQNLIVTPTVARQKSTAGSGRLSRSKSSKSFQSRSPTVRK